MDRFSAFAQSGFPEGPREGRSDTSTLGHVAGEVLVSFHDKVSDSKKEAIHAEIGTEVMSTIPGINVQRVRSTRGLSTKELLQTYGQRPEVKYVEPNQIIRLDDP